MEMTVFLDVGYKVAQLAAIGFGGLFFLYKVGRAVAIAHSSIKAELEAQKAELSRQGVQIGQIGVILTDIAVQKREIAFLHDRCHQLAVELRETQDLARAAIAAKAEDE